MKKLLCIILFIGLQQANAQLCFSPSTEYMNGNTGEFALCTADFNGDGKLDLAVADSKVTIWMGNGAGAFNGSSPPVMVGTDPECIISADFNKDNVPDLAVANTSSGNISILLGNGFGVSSSTNYNTGSGTKCLASTDFNGDSYLDLAVATTNSVSILLGSKAGDGTFGKPTNYALGANTPYSICIGDFNNDGKQDLATANNGSNNISVLLGNGDSTFQAYKTIPNIIYTPFSICALDYDKDGNTDLAVSAYSNNSGTGNGLLTVFKGFGSGNFGPTSSIQVGPQPRTVCAVDLNGDGNTDLAVSDNGINNVYVAVNPGGGTNFSATSTTLPVNSAVQNSRWITSGDFNGDNSPDLALTNYGSNNISILLNQAPFLKIAGTHAICAGTVTTLTASGAGSYTWSGSSQTTATISVTSTVSTSYTVSGTSTSCTITNSATDSIHVNPLPTVSVSATSVRVCNGRSITLNGAGTALSYTWSGGISNGTAFTPTASASYIVIGTNAINCQNTATVSVNVVMPVTPSICMVTTDSTSGYNYNIIHWTNTDYPGADSFIVYRDIASVYTRLGAVAKDSSHFTDIFRNIPSVSSDGGDPYSTYYQYTLAIRDSCGNLSAQSAYHQTTNVFLNGSNIDWNEYIIGGVNALGYDVYWDSLGVNNFVLHQSGLTSLQTNIPSFATYPNQVFRVDPILSYTCNVTQRQANPGNNPLTIRQKSHSNATKRTGNTTGIQQASLKNNQLRIYPNPASNLVSLGYTGINAIANINLYDASGRLVLQQTCTNGSQNQTIDLQSIEPGLYFIEAGGIWKILTISK
jgi:hypothetical protein